MQTLVSASIMCANLLNLEEEVRHLQKAGVDWLHIDVMDGSFVPNIVNGCPDVVRALKRVTDMPLDVHLMIREPEKHVEAFAKAGADYLVVHSESTDHAHRAVSQIKSLGVKAGVALNPYTSLNSLGYVIDDLDMVLIMTVNPGFAGQSFIESMLNKIKEARQLVGNREIDIEVDGGLTMDKIKQCAQAGANVFVAGTSSIFVKDLGKNGKSRIQNNCTDTLKTIHSIS